MSFISEFGNGHVVGGVISSPEYDTLPVREQAIRMGRAVGCPVVQKILRERGEQGARDRYLQVGFWFGQMVQAAEWVNPALAEELRANMPRRFGEPVGTHEAESVPPDYDKFIPPTETLTGYALPRLLIKLHDSSAMQVVSPTERHMAVWDLLEASASQSDTPAEYLAHCAQGAVDMGMEKDEVLKTVLPEGWYEEHNASLMTADTMTAMANYAPDVWGTYKSHTRIELDEMGVI